MSLWAGISRRTEQAANSVANYANRPYLGSIVAIDPAGGRAMVDGGPTGAYPVPLPQPMVSESAWIRGIPKGRGIGIILEQAAGVGEPIATRYNSAGEDLKRAQEYAGIASQLADDPTDKDVAARATTNFKTLRAGELHASSAGQAETYWGDQGTLAQRGGPLTRDVLARDGQITDSAPLFRRTGLLFKYGQEIRDEERLGVVFRSDPDLPAFRESPILVSNPLGFTAPPSGGIAGAVVGALTSTPMSAAKEWYLNIAWDGSPDFLYEHQIGMVFDDDAEDESDWVKSDWTGSKLRARYRYFTAPLGNLLEIQVDELGNVSAIWPDEATKGLKIDMTAGSIEVSVLDLLLTALRNATVNVLGKAAVNAQAGVEVTSAGGNVALAGLLTLLGATSGLQPTVNGVITGSSLDPLTGLPLATFNQGSTKVLAAL